MPRKNRRHRLLVIPMHLQKALRDRAMNDLIGQFLHFSGPRTTADKDFAHF